MTLHELIDTLQQQAADNPYKRVRVHLRETSFEDRATPIMLDIADVKYALHETIIELH